MHPAFKLLKHTQRVKIIPKTRAAVTLTGKPLRAQGEEYDGQKNCASNFFSNFKYPMKL